MKVEMTEQKNWLATGNGPMRPIVVEAYTRYEAVKVYVDIYGRQYAEMETHTHFALEEGQ